MTEQRTLTIRACDQHGDIRQDLTQQAEAERPEVFGLERYRVERTGQGFWPYCVRAGDGTRELFVGHLKQCKRVAAQLATAFEDGKFVAGALRAENAKLIEALDESDGDRWRLRSERDAALARVAELEMLLRKLSTNGLMQFSTVDEEMAVQAALGGAPVAQAGQVPQAWLDVQAERRRQITAEGWTPEHDDEHADGQMAQAAGCYALHAGGIGTDWPDGRQNGAALFWPWDKDSWKPTTPRRDLVKACALALAEIERLDRAAATQGGPSDA